MQRNAMMTTINQAPPLSWQEQQIFVVSITSMFPVEERLFYSQEFNTAAELRKDGRF